MNEDEKKVDQAWKEQVEQQKKQEPSKEPCAPNEGGAEEVPEANFGFFMTSLAMQAAISLGQMPNPVTQKVEENLAHAKLIIDTMGMLKEKTQGNLSADEDSLLDNLLYELRMQYLAKAKAGQ